MPEDELPRAWSMEPKERIKALSELASGSVNINHAIPIKRYYRSGVELERMVSTHCTAHFDTFYLKQNIYRPL